MVKTIEVNMLIIESRTWTIDKVVEISKSKYGLEVVGEVRELPSYLDQNFVFTAKDNQKYVLKIANPSEELDVLDMQNNCIWVWNLLWTKLQKHPIKQRLITSQND